MTKPKEKGFILFIVGASGSGKTSLLQELIKRNYIELALKLAEREKRKENDDIEQLSPVKQIINGKEYFMVNENPPFYYNINGSFYALKPFELFKEVVTGKKKGMVISDTLAIKNIKRMAEAKGYDIEFKVIAIEHELKKDNLLADRNNKAERLRSSKQIKEDIEMKQMLDKQYLNGEISFDEVRFSPIDYIFQKQESVEKLADMVIAELENNSFTLEEKLILRNIKEKREQQPEVPGA